MAWSFMGIILLVLSLRAGKPVSQKVIGKFGSETLCLLAPEFVRTEAAVKRTVQRHLCS